MLSLRLKSISLSLSLSLSLCPVGRRSVIGELKLNEWLICMNGMNRIELYELSTHVVGQKERKVRMKKVGGERKMKMKINHATTRLLSVSSLLFPSLL